MTVTLRTMRQGILQFALCLLVGIFIGGILLLDLPLKWQIAFSVVLGISLLMSMVGSPKRILLLVLALSTSIYFAKGFITRPGYFSLANGAGIDLSDVLAVLLLLVFLAKLALRLTTIRIFPLITIAALAWLILSSLSLVAARDSELAAFQLINMGKMLLLCWVVASSVGSEVDVTMVITGLMLGMLFQAVVGVYQGVTGHPTGLNFLTETAEVHQQALSGGLVNRVQGTLGHPNSFAMYISTVIPFALASLFSTTRRSLKVLAGITLCLGGPALIFSLSRSAWINFVLIISIVLALAVRRKRISSKAAMMIAGITCLILIGLTFFGPDVILSRLTSDDQGSAYSRLPLAQTALAIIRDHQWVGVGLNNYTLVSPQYDARAIADQSPLVVHNAFLLIAAETGLVGLAPFLTFLAILLTQAWRIVDRAPDDTVWVAGVGILSAFVALALHSMADYDLLRSTQVFTQFWIIAGLSAALIQRIEYEGLDARRVASPSIILDENYAPIKKWVTTDG
jgi:O-antigen ligase